MRHKVKKKKAGGTSSHNMAVIRNLATSLFESDQISTSLGNAKIIRPFVEKLITVAKKFDKMNASKALAAVLYTDGAIKKCLQYGELFKNRSGGYLRIVKDGYRHGDCAPVGIVQFVEKIS